MQKYRKCTLTVKTNITGCAVMHCGNGDSLEIGEWQNLTPHRIKMPKSIAKKIAVGE